METAESPYPTTQYLNSWGTSFQIRLMVFCMGVTCSGKTTFIDLCTVSRKRFGAIKVGNEMLLRYPPERFNGLAAMDDTEEEVWEIFQEQLDDRISEGKSIILVDGQPRTVSQVDKCLEAASEAGFSAKFLWFHVTSKELNERLGKRFEMQSGAHELSRHELSRQRMTNDKIQLYDVIQELFISEHFEPLFHSPGIVKGNEYALWLERLQNLMIT